MKVGKPVSILTMATALLALSAAAMRVSAQDFKLDSFAPKSAEPATAGPPGRQSPVQVSTQLSADAVTPDGTIKLAVIFDIKSPYHIQTRQPKLDFLVATKVEPTTLPQGMVAGDAQWPKAHPLKVDFGFGNQTLEFYVERSVVFMTVSVGKEVAPGDYDAVITTTHQACNDKSCLPPDTQELHVPIKVVAAGTAVTSANDELFAMYAGPSVGTAAPGDSATSNTLKIPFFGYDFTIDPNNIFLLLILSAVGGLLLNLTPCVLPVIPLKIMALTKSVEHRGHAILYGSIMSLGVVAFWLGLGLAVSLVSGFSAANQLFQYPAFTITVGVIIAVMGAGMCGAFATNLPQWVYQFRPTQDTVHGSFGFGIMTAVLSTPCTAPMMGATAAWSATQGVTITLVTFGSIGVGMASPYLVLSIFPHLVHKMPRTGPASELIKQVMGLLMIAAATYFLGTGIAGMTTTPPDPPTRLYWWAVGLASIAAGGWLAYRTFRITPSAARRAIFGGIGVAIVAIGVTIGFRMTDRGPIDWVYYTPERLAEAQAKKNVVVLEFTAEWCLNCHALEQTVLHSKHVTDLFADADVTPIKVDITGNNTVGNAKLLEVGRRTIPLLIVYDTQGKEVFRSDAYTVNQVVEAIGKARGGVAKADTPGDTPTPGAADTPAPADGAASAATPTAEDEDNPPPLPPSPVKWVPYSDEAYAAAVKSGKTLVLDFAADWCLDCRAVEVKVLRHADVVPQLNRDDVIAMRGDMTGDDPAALAAEAQMKKLGHTGLPYLFVFAPDGKRVYEGENVTTDALLGAIRQARGTLE